jgi:hypothetical protein
MRSSPWYLASFLLPAVLASTPAWGATWVVDQGGGGDATTVAGGMALASYGDTVLVNPGTYHTNNVVMVDGVVLTSAGGPDATTLDGGLGGPILLCSGIGTDTAIEGFTFTRALGDSVGGAVVCLAASSPQIRDNRFIENISLYGAGIGAASGSAPLIEDNLFVGNASIYEAGAILVIHDAAVVIQGNEFRENRSLSRSGGAIWIGDETPATVVDNVFFDNEAAHAGAALWIGRTSGEARVERNLFVRSSSVLGGGAVYCSRITVTIRDNTFYGNSSLEVGGALGMDAEAGVVFTNNIVARSTSPGVQIGSPSTIDCNDFWDNPDGDLVGGSHGTGDFFLDPMFCDAPEDNFRLFDTSPCVGGVCGQVGAYGVGCMATATERATWGRVKARF